MSDNPQSVTNDEEPIMGVGFFYINFNEHTQEEIMEMFKKALPSYFKDEQEQP